LVFLKNNRQVSYIFFYNKNYIYTNNSSKKFQPLNDNSFIYDCSLNNTSIDKLSSEKIIEFIEKN